MDHSELLYASVSFSVRPENGIGQVFLKLCFLQGRGGKDSTELKLKFSKPLNYILKSFPAITFYLAVVDISISS